MIKILLKKNYTTKQINPRIAIILWHYITMESLQYNIFIYKNKENPIEFNIILLKKCTI